MRDFLSLRQFLDSWALQSPDRLALAETIRRIAIAAGSISRLISKGALGGNLGAVVGGNASGDEQKSLDVLANSIFLEALANSPVAFVVSEENEALVQLRAGEPLAVAIDPLDGSSNLDTNVSVGSIFSIWPCKKTSDFIGTAATEVLEKGTAQLAAGFAMYGPQTALVLTVRQGVQIFTLDPQTSEFILTRSLAQIPMGTCEFAINASNYGYWDKPVREFVDDCMDGDRHSASHFNMRWIASLVAEAFRILSRGGIFLYPRDARPGYESGRLRLVYEANPIALLMEEAGGAATDGARRILEMAPASLHQRVPLVFGSVDQVARVTRHHTELYLDYGISPLFGRRGLFERQGPE
jgi:fructose-1,6-bisphosphatase I